MSDPIRIRVRARRNLAGTVLEWHPADEEDAKELLYKPHFVITLLYRAVDRSRVSDCDIVARLEVLPRSHQLDSIDVPAKRDALSIQQMSSIRADIEQFCRGEPAHA